MQAMNSERERENSVLVTRIVTTWWGSKWYLTGMKMGGLERAFPDILEVQQAFPDATWTWNEESQQWVLSQLHAEQALGN
jgi:hypothetical protein